MASANEQLLFAAKTDSEEILKKLFAGELGDYDINYRDGLGNTALHYAASTPSPTALDLLVDNEATELDVQNRLDKATPLHLALELQNADAKLGVIEILLDAGADPRIKDKNGATIADYLHPQENDTDKEIKRLINLALAQLTYGAGDADIADDSDGGHSGSGSDSE